MSILLSEFVGANDREIVVRCRARATQRLTAGQALEADDGIPRFLAHLRDSLRAAHHATTAKVGSRSGDLVGADAAEQGGKLLQGGFTVSQVVHAYGDICQVITKLAIERSNQISTEDFRALNLCLDNAIAGAVTEFGRRRDQRTDQRATEELGFLAHELRNLLGTATLAFEVLQSGGVGISGSTGAVLERALSGLRTLIDRSMATVRLRAGVEATAHVSLALLVEEIEVSSTLEAKARVQRLVIEREDGDAFVDADPQILASIVMNLMQNAFKYSPRGAAITLRTTSTPSHVRIEVHDACGGLPAGTAEKMFEPYHQQSRDRSGLGLGLTICRRGVAAIGGTLRVRDVPTLGCVFTVELPRSGVRA